MTDALHAIAEFFPLMRGGGGFLIAVGLGIVVGSFGSQKMRIVSLIAGAALGVTVMAVGGATKVIFAGLPYPAIWQWVVVGIAFLVEGYLVSVVATKFKIDTREFWMWMLFIVGAHFLILGFSHGPICAILAIVCMINAMIGLKSTVDFRVFWGIDGCLKIAAGALMIAASFP